jgi:PKD repeat protein
MMFRFRGVRLFLLPALAGCALTMCALAAPALAITGYGELERFGGAGAFTITGATNAFGVDPTDDNVYVGDEPTHGEFRIQEFEHNAGNWTAVASTSFTPKVFIGKNKAKEEFESAPEGIEGVAVDPVDKLIYVLVVYERGFETKPEIDEGAPVAGALYAFSTAEAGKLKPAPGTGAEGLLMAPEALKAEGEKYEEALLSPAGITVDPTTHQVVILGEIEKKGKHEEEDRHIALLRVSAGGTLEAQRYVDPKNAEEEEEAGAATIYSGPSDSPVISQTGQVYIQQPDQIVQIVPASFSTSVPPTPVFEYGGGLVNFDGEGQTKSLHGDGLSISTEDSELYADALIDRYPGALALKYTETGETAEAAQLGWTGGQSVGNECAIALAGANESNVHPALAAGGEGHLFVLDPIASEVVEFGLGGKGCPAASATKPSATVNGKSLSETESVPVGTEVKLSSSVTQADALSVKWDFGDGTTETVDSDEQQTTGVTHKFAKEGVLEVTETIETDDLATPTLVVTRKVVVGAQLPKARFSAPEAVTLDALGLAAVEFNGSASSAPGGGHITEYVWNFGDGTPDMVTTTPTASHAYKAAGAYTVTLKVVDELGASEPFTRTVNVSSPEPAKEKEAGKPASKEPEKAKEASTPPVPDATLASTALAVSPAGAVALKVTCPAGESSCTGTVTLRTLGAVSAARGRGAKHKKASVLTLGSGSFTIAGGQVKVVTLHLSAKARALLARTHVLRAQATIVAHDPAGATHTTQVTVTLRAPTRRRGKH